MTMAKERPIRWLLATVVVASMLSGCGGGGTAGSAPVAANSPVNGSAPANPGATGSATLSWAAPVENIDGSAVTDLAGYRIYHGTSADSLNNVVQLTSPGISIYVFDNLSPGTHYFAITAYNAAGVESDRSPVESKAVL
jgi:hypothetical protein